MNNNGLNIIRRIYAGYWIFLQNVSDVTARNFTHPGLARITYGIELEFLSSSNRYIISSRANSCMLRQNNDFWKNNIDYQSANIADAGKLITVTSASNLNVTVDGSLDLAVGQRIDLARLGTGTVTVVASSTTVNGTPGLKLRAQYSAATLICTAADTYLLVGDLDV